MKLETRGFAEVPAEAKAPSKGKYAEIVPAFQQLKLHEAICVDLESVNTSVVRWAAPVMKRRLKSAGIEDVETRTDKEHGHVWLFRKGAQVAAPPVKAVEAVRPAAPLGAASAAGGA